MKYKQNFFNINFYVLLFISGTGLFINNNILVFLLLFYLFINLKDNKNNIISFEKSNFILTLFIIFISIFEIMKFNSNNFLLFLLFSFKNHLNQNFSYLKYNLNKNLLKDIDFDFIFKNENCFKLYLNNKIIHISPNFCGVIFKKSKYPIDNINKYLLFNQKEIDKMTDSDFNLLSIINY